MGTVEGRAEGQDRDDEEEVEDKPVGQRLDRDIRKPIMYIQGKHT